MTKEIDITSEKMPEVLKTKLELLTPFARAYAEYRAKGLKQPDAAEKAGSNANGRAALGRVGWNTEQLDGVKEYMLWLEHKRAKAAVIDDIEIVQKLRNVYDEAMHLGKLSDANKALELLGNMIGAFANKNLNSDGKDQNTEKQKIKNNTSAFTEDNENLDIKDRMKKLQNMMKVVD